MEHYDFRLIAVTAVLPAFARGEFTDIPWAKEVLGWLNAKLAALNVGNVTNWAAATMSLRNVTTNTFHTCTGVCPTKMPDYPYSAQGQDITWTLPCADILNG